jgi:peptidoglycan hydrolase-like protein with peptidoglycan-binding domain
MVRKLLLISLLVVFVFAIAGCASGRQKDLEMQKLRNQVTVLEAQVQAKDQELSSLKESLTSAEAEKNKEIIPEAKSRPSIKQIQIALRNAGFEPGALDGKMGRQTKEAIKSFQKANNLKADGKVGKQTWAALRSYLVNKIK